jgi:hypothetical protein
MIFQNFGFNQNYPVVAPTPGGGVITSGLQAYYDVGNSSSYPGSGSTVFDLSGNGRNALLVGDIAYSGSNGGVLSLGNTSNGTLAVSSSVTTALNAGTDATIMQWIKLKTSPPPSDPQTGFIYMTNQTNGIGNHYPYTDNNIYTNVLKTSRPSLGNPVSSLVVWHVMTISTSPGSNNWKMYINTTSQGTDTGDSSLALYGGGTYGAQIGTSGGGPDRLEGALGPTLIYNQQLSLTDMQTNIDFFASRF